MIAAAVLLGWVLGVAADVPEAAVGFLFAFLAGGAVLNDLGNAMRRYPAMQTTTPVPVEGA